jgi:hypothetical protein
MKKLLAITFLMAAVAACKQTAEEKKETEKIDSTVNTTIKSDKEKADSVLEYYKKKIDSAGDAIPDMPTQ